MTLSGYRNKFVKLKNAKKHKPSSNVWLQRQINDPYVAKAKIEGYRSRAAYKLLEINQKFHIFKLGMNIVDLGAAPGGWSQVAAQLTKSNKNDSKSRIVAIDLLYMEEIAGVVSIKKDFYDVDTVNVIKSIIGEKVHIVMSDMAANSTGHQATDHLRIVALCGSALDFALKILEPDGHFIAKVLRGGTENDLLNKVKVNFKTVKHFKPLASRKESSEFYLIALNKK